MEREIKLGGTAIFDLAQRDGGFIVAMTGDFKGAAFARVIGEPKREGNHTVVDLEHVFYREDGSMLQTKDRADWIHVDGQNRVLASGTYTVVNGTGAFSGAKGELKSWGSADPTTGQGVLRFTGADRTIII